MAYCEVTIGLPVTEKTASPARGWRIMENGLAGLTFGVIVLIRSALIAFALSAVLIGVRYLDREACVESGCWTIGVLPLTTLIIARGPGVIVEARLVADLLRRRSFVFVNEATTETL